MIALSSFCSCLHGDLNEFWMSFVFILNIMFNMKKEKRHFG